MSGMAGLMQRSLHNVRYGRFDATFFAQCQVWPVCLTFDVPFFAQCLVKLTDDRFLSVSGTMETDDAIYFYGIHDDYGYLSNFYRTSFRDADREYCCTEQYFMMAKCRQFDPLHTELMDSIMAARNPATIKELGRQVRNYDEKVWETMRYSVMKEALLLKFGQNVYLRRKLLATAPKQLYEASKKDKIWGIGMYAKKAIVTSPTLYGCNLLGKCLMEVRAHFLDSSL
jgi:ribA/ribD-fused uncharacterized protein